MRQNMHGGRIGNVIFEGGSQFQTLVQTLGGTLTMAAGMPSMLVLDPGGAGRTVLLPPELAGAVYTILNAADAVEDLTVKDDSNTTTYAVVGRDSAATFYSDGVRWFAFTGVSPTETGYLDGVVAGTAAASKAVVLDANRDIATLRHVTIDGNLVTGATTLSEADLAKIDAITAGTVAVGKAVVPTTGKVVDELDITLLKVGTVDKTNVIIGVASGYKIARSAAPVALDGTNPTSVAHGLTTCLSATVTLVGSAAPALSTSTLTAVINGAAIDVYAWKPTGAGDTTLIASTGTEEFNWIAVGT